MFRKLAILGMSCLILVVIDVPSHAKDKEKEKDSGHMVDSGSFGVFRNGQRLATETFSVQESASGKIITSQLKAEPGIDNASQSSELKLSTAGELTRYEWHEQSPGKASLTVTPNEQFLIERITTATSDKPAEQPFLMPTSTMVLDNNSFVQREVLAWKYLAAACRADSGATRCSRAPAQFGVLVPQERISMSVSLELVGKEKVKINGSERELLRLNMKDDTGQWALWLDEQNAFRMMRILISADNTEVVRD